MAVQLHKPTRPVNEVLKRFAQDAMEAVRTNFGAQHIWPVEIYPGFAAINAQRKKRGQWYATGRGSRSFHYSVSAQEGHETISISYIDYLRYVDMGVGKGRSYADVQNERKARHNRRYVSFWDTHSGDTHRPAIMMEMRHVQGRMQRYFEDYIGREGEMLITKTFEELGDIIFKV